MPRRKTHAYVGMTAGIGYAAFQAKEQGSANLFVEAAGGALGGWWGGQLPDVIEPGTHPWHRSLAHSGVAGTTSLTAGRSKLNLCQDQCRRQAEACRIKRESLKMVPHPSQPNLFVPAPSDQWEHLCLTIQELFWRFAAGFANGFAAGYVSHLALDAGTPRSLPLLVRGF
jgi:hypothetical protein